MLQSRVERVVLDDSGAEAAEYFSGDTVPSEVDLAGDLSTLLLAEHPFRQRRRRPLSRPMIQFRM